MTIAIDHDISLLIIQYPILFFVHHLQTKNIIQMMDLNSSTRIKIILKFKRIF